MGIDPCLVDDQVGLPLLGLRKSLQEGPLVVIEAVGGLLDVTANAPLVLLHAPVGPVDRIIEEIGKLLREEGGAVSAVLVAIQNENPLLRELLGHECQPVKGAVPGPVLRTGMVEPLPHVGRDPVFEGQFGGLDLSGIDGQDTVSDLWCPFPPLRVYQAPLSGDKGTDVGGGVERSKLSTVEQARIVKGDVACGLCGAGHRSKLPHAGSRCVSRISVGKTGRDGVAPMGKITHGKGLL